MILEVIVLTIKEIKAMSTLKIVKDRLKDKRSQILPLTSWQLTNRTMSDISRHSRHSICLAPVRESRFRIPWNFCLWNPVPGDVLLEEPQIQLKESGILLRIRIRNPRRGIQNPRLSWISLHGAICQSFFLAWIYNMIHIRSGETSRPRHWLILISILQNDVDILWFIHKVILYKGRNRIDYQYWSGLSPENSA